MLEAVARIILRYRVAVIAVLIALTGFMAYMATFVKLSYESAKILPESDSTYAEYLKFKRQFGEDGTVMVIGFQSDKIWQLNTFNDWYKLTDEIKKVEGIQEVLSIGRSFAVRRNDSLQQLDFKPLVVHQLSTQQEADSIHDLLTKLPFYEGLLFNPKTNATLMAITFDQAKLNTKGRIFTVRKIKEMADAFAAQNNLELHYSGLPYIRTAVSDKIAHEMKMFVGLALLVTALILIIFFRSVQAVVFPLIVVIFGVIWSFGTMVLMGYKITILTSLLAPLIIVWFGFDLASKVVMVSLVCFFPMFINTAVGLKQTNPALLDLMRAFSASRLHVLLHIKIPSAAGHIFAGLQIAIVLGLIGAVVAEFVSSTKGLGHLINAAAVNLETNTMFAALFSLAVLGILGSQAIRRLHARVVFWDRGAIAQAPLSE